jgi:asparagine synthase (glutamine-hydrolysing)
MCGIAGIVGIRDMASATSKIKLMSQAIAHRGPDAEAFFIDDGVVLGHRRLSIIDLSVKANQPMFDASGRYSIVLNGEIYNYRDVKKNFPDYHFCTESDTEVILAAYAKHGADCLSLLNGMFAFAIWDKERRELFVARDRLGVKPLYYAQTAQNEFVFASEIRAIMSSGLLERRLNKQALYDYLMYQSVYSPQTIVEGIYQLPAGEFAVFSNSTFEKKSYWKIEKPPSFAFDDNEPAVKKKVQDLLLRSVERRMISDVRLGAFLSGGIDSSAVVALMSEVSAQPVDTFSVTFDEKQFDESRYSDLIAERFNTRHTRIKLSPKDFLDELPNALLATDSPSGDGINTYVVSKATKRAGITVALSGLGGDELFAGYPNFHQWLKTQRSALAKAPSVLRKPIAAVIANSGSSKRQRMADLMRVDELDITAFYPISRQAMSQRFANEFSRNGTYEVSIRKLLASKHAAIKQFPLLSQFSIAELLGYTQNVLLKDTDQFSMASALEVREPFFDYKLVEYVLQIPDEIKFPKFPKRLLVESIAPLLPDEIVYRKKMGFVFPWNHWMRNELRSFCEKRIERLADREVLDPKKLRQNWTDFARGSKTVTWSQLWHLVVLSEWLENNKF